MINHQQAKQQKHAFQRTTRSMADADADQEMAEASQQQQVVPLQEPVYTGGVFTSQSQGAGAPAPYTIGLRDILDRGIVSCSLRSVVCTAYSSVACAPAAS